MWFQKFGTSNIYAKRLFIALNLFAFVTAILVTTFNLIATFHCSYVTVLVRTNSFCYGFGSLTFIGLLSIFTVAIGFCFLISNNFLYLLAYLTGSLAVACFSLGCCAIALYLRTEMIPQLRLNMQESLLYNYGHTDDWQTTLAWDHLQSDNQCCGMLDDNAEQLYANSTWFRLQTLYPLDRVPDSCCLRCTSMIEKYCKPNNGATEAETTTAEESCVYAKNLCGLSHKEYADIQACKQRSDGFRRNDNNSFLNRKGCYRILRQQLNIFIIKIFMNGVLMALIHFACFFVSFVLLERATPQNERLLNS